MSTTSPSISPPQRQLSESGFTLIELTIVMLIITLLSAIALPTVLSQANKAKQSEAKTYTTALVRAQQAYFLEKSTFAPSLDLLAVTISNQGSNYQYSISGPYNVSASNEHVIIRSQSLKSALKSYSGIVQVLTVQASGEFLAISALCENNSIGLSTMAAPLANETGPTCASGTSPVSK